MTTLGIAPEILIIDDEPDLRQMLCDVLEAADFNCTVAPDCTTAESLIRQHQYDVIISDIALPDVTGLQFLQTINTLAPNAKTILITAHKRSDWTREAFQNGVYDYLEKPFDLTVLQNTINQALADVQQHVPRPPSAQDSCVLLLDQEGIALYASENSAAVIGINPGAVVGRSFDQLIPSAGITFSELIDAAGVSQRATITLTDATNKPYQAEISFRPVAMPDDKKVYLLSITDLTCTNADFNKRPTPRFANIKRTQDELTGLPNHSAFQEELRRIRNRCSRYGHSASLLFLTIDHLNEINHTHGFHAGDYLLVQMSGLLRLQVRIADYAARFSGTCFALILPETNREGAAILGQRLCQAVADHKFLLSDQTTHLSASCGIVECPSGFFDSQDELLRRGREALRHAQQHGNGSVITWDPMLSLGGKRPASDPPQIELAAKPNDFNRQLRSAYLEMTLSLVAAVEAKDPYTKDHSLNVADYAEHLARQFGLDEEIISIIRCAGILHDVGKIGVPDAILTKPGSLTDAEFDIIKQHPTIGADIIAQSSFLRAEVELVRSHHERYDGTGYPHGLTGDQVPIGARILQVADAFDAMTCRRSYKAGYDLDKIFSELKRHSGTQFDPEIAQAAITFFAQHPEKINFPD